MSERKQTMTIEDEIAAVKAAAEKKLRQLRERERKQQQVVDARLLALLRSQHADLADQLEARARTQLSAETAERSAKAKAARPSRSARLGSVEDAGVRYAGQSMEYAR